MEWHGRKWRVALDAAIAAQASRKIHPLPSAWAINPLPATSPRRSRARRSPRAAPRVGSFHFYFQPARKFPCSLPTGARSPRAATRCPASRNWRGTRRAAQRLGDRSRELEGERCPWVRSSRAGRIGGQVSLAARRAATRYPRETGAEILASWAGSARVSTSV